MNQRESVHRLTSSHGWWIKPKLYLAFKMLPSPHLPLFQMYVFGPYDLETQTSFLNLKLVTKWSDSGSFCLLPVFCLDCASLWKAISYFTLGFCSEVNITHAFPESFTLESSPVTSIFIPKGYHYFLTKTWSIWVYLFAWVRNLLISGEVSDPWGQRFF